MDSNSVVFDISSDEEPAIEEPKEFDDDCNWLTELLRTVDKEKDDSDEVVIVGEYNPPKPKSKSKSSNQVADIKFVLDGDDDDCVVLGGDPDKPVSAADDVCRNETDSSDDGDDVLVVAEKGQVACRDYPHPRHLCVEFPFGSTPHERHCNLCHCYVCDSLAPCVHWGTGVSTIDHCHATDKQETWKNQRKICRTGKDVPIPVSKLHDITVPMALPLLNHVASLDIVPHNQSLTHNPMLQNQVSRIHPIRSCSSSTIPNIIRRHRRRQPGCVLGGNKHLSRSVSQQALGVRTDVQRDRHPNALGYARNVAPLATSKESPSSMHYGLPNANFESHTYQSSPQPNMGSVIVNTMPSRSEVGSQPTLQSNDGQSLYQLGNQGENDADSFFSDFDFCQVNNSSQSDQGASIENIIHGTVSNNEPSTVKLLNSQFAEIESAQFHYNDHELVDSFFLNQAVPVVSDGFVPHDLNGFSPERPAIDTGLSFRSFMKISVLAACVCADSIKKRSPSP
ncbi:RPM1 interacting protein 13 isoform X2 [Populus alba]|uniref:RPM1 interacting protein 13 isoform X2 n=1 Tax=Populus alba TaxID=43335 RepID=UPI003CC70882